MRTFGQVPLALWRGSNFTAMSEDGRLALLYLWCGPHSTSAGIYVLLDGYAAIDLVWPLERWIKARQEVEAAGFILCHPDSGTVMLQDYFAANRPSNGRHLAAIRNQIESIACPELKARASEVLEAIVPKQAPPPPATTIAPQYQTSYLKRQPSAAGSR